MFKKPDIIVATDEDFAVFRGRQPIGSVRWDDVVRVLAYKRDELTTDLICLDVELQGGKTWFLHEEVVGWDDFLEAAERALPGMLPLKAWLPQVAEPPFARSEQVVFERGAPAA